jgi:membrane protease YdiL (CAAX protease family)
MNYLFKIRFFHAIESASRSLLSSTLCANVLSIAIFSLLIFGLGKHNLASMGMQKDHILPAVKVSLCIWIVAQLMVIALTYFERQQIIFVRHITPLVGGFLGQLAGNALFEEMIYRGLLFLQLYILFKGKRSDTSAMILAMIISQGVFAIIHIPNRLMLNHVSNLTTDLLNLFFFGVMFTLIFIKTQNLFFIIGIHAFFNSPLNVIKTSVPTSLFILLLALLTALMWEKIPFARGRAVTLEVTEGSVS